MVIILAKKDVARARTLLIKERSSRGGHLFATIKTYEGIRKVGYPNDPDLESFLYIRSPNGGFRRMDIGVEWISAEEYPDLLMDEWHYHMNPHNKRPADKTYQANIRAFYDTL